MLLFLATALHFLATAQKPGTVLTPSDYDVSST